MVELVQGLERNLTAEDVAVDPPGQHVEDLVTHMNPSRNTEDVVKFFQSPLLGLRDPKVDHEEGSHVQSPG